MTHRPVECLVKTGSLKTKSPDSCESGRFVEMPGIEPGSDVAFVRLLRAQSAWSFIDLSNSQTSNC